MKSLQTVALAALVAFAMFASRASAQNLLANPGFEDPITFDGPPFIGSWEGFNGGAGSSASNSTASPRTGAQNADLSITGVANTFAGVFQDVLVTAGQPLTVGGWQRTPGAFDVVNEVRIEWRNSVSNTEISRTANQSPALTGQYAQFSYTFTAPAGADTARFVYAIQSFGGGAAHVGTVYLDDMFATVPEPASLSLLGAGALLIIRRRRHTA